MPASIRLRRMLPSGRGSQVRPARKISRPDVWGMVRPFRRGRGFRSGRRSPSDPLRREPASSNNYRPLRQDRDTKLALRGVQNTRIQGASLGPTSLLNFEAVKPARQRTGVRYCRHSAGKLPALCAALLCWFAEQHGRVIAMFRGWLASKARWQRRPAAAMFRGWFRPR
jgi:hypothetical protein